MRKFPRSIPAVLFFILVCPPYLFGLPIGVSDTIEDGTTPGWMLLAGIGLFCVAVIIRKRRRAKQAGGSTD
jgi:hypothetical protein